MTTSAEDLGTSGYDYLHGYGVVDGCALRKKLCAIWWWDICKVHPWICRGVFRWPELPLPRPYRWFEIPGVPFKIPRVMPGAGRPPRVDDEAQVDRFIEEIVERSGVSDPVQLGYLIGVMHAQNLRLMQGGETGGDFGAEPHGSSTGQGDCSCDSG